MANALSALLHPEHGTLYRYISVRKPSADNSSSLGSKLISSNVHTYEFYLRELLRSELTYLLTKDQGKETPLTSRLYHTVYYIRYLCSSAFLFLRRAGTEYKPSVTDGRPHLSNDLPFTTSGQETGDFSSMSLSLHFNGHFPGEPGLASV